MLTAAVRGFRVFSISSNSVSRLCASVMDGAICSPHRIYGLIHAFITITNKPPDATLIMDKAGCLTKVDGLSHHYVTYNAFPLELQNTYV